MEVTEGEGGSEMDFTEIETNADSLDGSVIFHVIKNVSGFVLYMHQQIPSILQDTSLEFEAMQTEYKELDVALTQTEVKASSRRKHIGRMQEIKRGIRKLEKLMNAVSGLESALQLIISEIPSIKRVILVLGASPIRPQYVYELHFSHGNDVLRNTNDFAKSGAAEGLSRKAIRALISKGAGSGSYPGPTKFFLLVKAPTSLDLPQHFLPKRDYRYSKKAKITRIVPFRLRLKCRSQDLEMDMPDSISNDLIWFQCRHVVKGLAFKTTTDE